MTWRRTEIRTENKEQNKTRNRMNQKGNRWQILKEKKLLSSGVTLLITVWLSMCTYLRIFSSSNASLFHLKSLKWRKVIFAGSPEWPVVLIRFWFYFVLCSPSPYHLSYVYLLINDSSVKKHNAFNITTLCSLWVYLKQICWSSWLNFNYKSM
mgnify:CR=1 FL=1